MKKPYNGVDAKTAIGISVSKPELQIQGKVFVYWIQVIHTERNSHIRLILLQKIRPAVPAASQICVGTLAALYRAREGSSAWPPISLWEALEGTVTQESNLLVTAAHGSFT